MDDGINLPTQEQRLTTGTFRAFSPEQRLFNRYLIRQELGRGGRGVVWLAQDMRLFCFVALKFLADELVREPEALQELRHETLVSRKITHPHIMRIYDFEQDDSAAAISMEYVEGETLSQLRYKRERHCFDTDEIRPWMLQLSEALYYAHSVAGIVHRDLKPSNLMIGIDGRLKITDFGIASVIADSMSRVTRTQIVSGTLPYMSPQQALGDLPRESDDIYSFGAVIYELLTSRPPFFRGNVAAQIHTAQIPPMAVRRKELGREGPPIPQVWEDIVSSCLAKSPSDRPATAKVIADWLEKGARDSLGGRPAMDHRRRKSARSRVGMPGWSWPSRPWSSWGIVGWMINRPSQLTPNPLRWFRPRRRPAPLRLHRPLVHRSRRPRFL
ncbi:MAG: serine/threonine-protein kinase [Chthoniobacter sp.]